MSYESRVSNCLMDMICPRCSTLRKRVSLSFPSPIRTEKSGQQGGNDMKEREREESERKKQGEEEGEIET